MMGKQLAEKIFILGIDGLDPRFTKRMLREGKMPNMQKLIDIGACREDLSMLGAHPTITPVSYTHLDVYKRQVHIKPESAEQC